MSNKLTAFHMLNGAIVLAQLLEVGDTFLKVRRPINLIVQQNPKNPSEIGMGMSPLAFPFYQSPKEQPEIMEISLATILYKHELNPDLPTHKDLIDAHAKEFGSLIMATSGVSMKIPR